MASQQLKKKLDLLKLHREEYAAPKQPTLIEVGEASYLTACGNGAPGSELFERRVGALYAVAYTLKFESKSAGRDYVVGKLEGLYGVDGQSLEELGNLPTSEWNWRLMIRLPEFVSGEHLAAARRTLQDKGKVGDFDAVSIETVREGTCVQMLHLGPYEEASRTIEAMEEFARTRGLTGNMWHHEIYLSDPRRVPPERLRTILRRPVA